MYDFFVRDSKILAYGVKLTYSMLAKILGFVPNLGIYQAGISSHIYLLYG